MRLDFELDDVIGFISLDSVNSLFIKIDNSVYFCSVESNKTEFCLDVLVKKMGKVLVKPVDKNIILQLKLENEFANSDYIEFILSLYSNNLLMFSHSNTKDKIKISEYSDGIIITYNDQLIKITDSQIYNLTKPYRLTRKGMLKCLHKNMGEILVLDNLVRLPIIYGEKIEFITI